MDIYHLVSRVIALFAGFEVKPQLRRLISGDGLCMEILGKSKALCRRQVIGQDDPRIIADRLVRIRIEDYFQHRLFQRFCQHIAEPEGYCLALSRELCFPFCIFLTAVHGVHFISDAADRAAPLFQPHRQGPVLPERDDRITHGRDLHLLRIPGKCIHCFSIQEKRDPRKRRRPHIHDLIPGPPVYHQTADHKRRGKYDQQHTCFDKLSFHPYSFSPL